MSIVKYVFGVDIASDSFRVCSGCLETPQLQRLGERASFGNTRSQFPKLLRWAKRQRIDPSVPVWFVMEATGVYHEELAYYLVAQGYGVSIIMPKKIKAYAASLDIKSKTDDWDAQVLTRFGLERALVAWTPPSEAMRALRALTREYQSLNGLSAQVQNQLHALSRAHHTAITTEKRLKALLQLYAKQQKKIEQELHALVDQDPDLKSHVDNVITLEGVGFMTVVQAAAETWGFDQFTNTKQLTSYTGLDIVIQQSGKRSGRASISKRGNGLLRQLMFMPALTAIRCNAHLRTFYLRLVERKKNKMIALIAVARKLLCLIFTLWKKNVPYDPNYHHRNLQPALA